MPKQLTDTELLDYMERYWRRKEDPPVSYDGEGSFSPNTTGMWPSKMTLREALVQARDPRAGKARLEKYFAEKEVSKHDPQAQG